MQANKIAKKIYTYIYSIYVHINLLFENSIQIICKSNAL